MFAKALVGSLARNLVGKATSAAKETVREKAREFLGIQDSKLEHAYVDGREYIVCAAMLMDNGDIVTGVRHYSPDMRAIMSKAYGSEYHKSVKEQGFITQRGRFVNRLDAWVLAEKNGQIRREVSTPGTLYSENLY